MQVAHRFADCACWLLFYPLFSLSLSLCHCPPFWKLARCQTFCHSFPLLSVCHFPLGFSCPGLRGIHGWRGCWVTPVTVTSMQGEPVLNRQRQSQQHLKASLARLCSDSVQSGRQIMPWVLSAMCRPWLHSNPDWSTLPVFWEEKICIIFASM